MGCVACQTHRKDGTNVIGWRNPRGGCTAPSLFYSLIETTKANGIEPQAHLRTVFTELPQAIPVEQTLAMLPVLAGEGNLA